MADNISEATLEGRIPHILQNIFPSFDQKEITHQKNFTIRFGHHSIVIDNKRKDKAQGRLDILVEVKNEPVVLLELKKPNMPLTIRDAEQGISYARLTDPITPLTVISNGVKTEIYNTYTGKELEGDTVGDELIQKVLTAGMQLAAHSKSEAISLLLGEDVQVFSQVIKEISIVNFSPFIGELLEFDRPICAQFSIPRSLSSEILKLTMDNHLIALIGSTYSGKTNVLWQVYNQTDWGSQSVYYVDASNSYGALQQLANFLSKELKTPVNTSQVRNWIINGFIANENHSIIVLLDNWGTNIHPDLQKEFLELIDLFRGTGNAILIAVDKTTYRDITLKRTRVTRNLIGHESKIIELGRLSENEFKHVNNLMFKCSEHFLGLGAEYHPWFQQPRSLRVLAGLMKKELDETPEMEPPPAGMSRALEIPSVPGDFMLKMVAEIPTSPEFRGYLKKHAQMFLEDMTSNLSPIAELSRYRTGAVNLIKLKKTIEESKIEDFVKQGFLLKEYFSEDEILIYPVVVELLSIELPQIIASKTLEIYTGEKGNIIEVYKKYKTLCSNVPYGDVVGAEVLKSIGKKDAELYGELFNQLLEDSPKEELVTDGTELLTRIKNASVKIQFKGDGDEKIRSNLLPWSIASLLMLHPMKAVDEPEDYFGFLTFLRLLGGYNGGLLFVSPSFEEPFSLLYQNVPKYGEVLSSQMGIVEPIVHSMRNAIRIIPNVMLEFTRKVTREENFHLIFRLNLASRHGYQGLVDEEGPFKTIYDETYAKLKEMLKGAFLDEMDTDMKKLRDQHNESMDLNTPNE